VGFTASLDPRHPWNTGQERGLFGVKVQGTQKGKSVVAVAGRGRRGRSRGTGSGHTP
jgi:hypothetical protein